MSNGLRAMCSWNKDPFNPASGKHLFSSTPHLWVLHYSFFFSSQSLVFPYKNAPNKQNQKNQKEAINKTRKLKKKKKKHQVGGSGCIKESNR
jgi:hypothetical protein